jgi:hypothetical protein
MSVIDNEAEPLTSPKSTRIDWKRVIASIKEVELPWFQERDITPTLRTLFYTTHIVWC